MLKKNKHWKPKHSFYFCIILEWKGLLEGFFKLPSMEKHLAMSKWNTKMSNQDLNYFSTTFLFSFCFLLLTTFLHNSMFFWQLFHSYASRRRCSHLGEKLIFSSPTKFLFFCFYVKNKIKLTVISALKKISCDLLSPVPKFEWKVEKLCSQQ